jgi:hypothetical protein
VQPALEGIFAADRVLRVKRHVLRLHPIGIIAK